ncbi:MAG: hypothetical protein RIR96_1018 [Bacteroidota bacterium]|jgi:hypothetical protein
MVNNSNTVFDCPIIHFPKIQNRSGNITPIQNELEVPFAIQRVYYLYDVPGGESRGAHAHRELEQVIVAVSGSFDVTIDDGRNKKTVSLNRPYFGLHLKPGMWRELSNFSSGAICLVLASMLYKESDYIRDYEEFKMFKSDLIHRSL